MNGQVIIPGRGADMVRQIADIRAGVERGASAIFGDDLEGDDLAEALFEFATSVALLRRLCPAAVFDQLHPNHPTPVALMFEHRPTGSTGGPT